MEVLSGDKPLVFASASAAEGGLKKNKGSRVQASPLRSLLPLALLVALSATIIASVCLGAVPIAPGELLSILAHKAGLSDSANFQEHQEAVLLTLRLPRVLLGVLVGAGLAVSGAAMQGLFRNPLAEPGLIGISSGASVSAATVIVLGNRFFSGYLDHLGYYGLSLVAFLGAALTTLLVYRISVYRGTAVMTTLLLAGIAINALTGSFTGLLTYVAKDDELRSLTFWGLGSLGGASWDAVAVLLPFVAVPLVCLPFLSRALNVLALGEAQAAHAGVNLLKLKRAIVILSTMAVGASVAMCGMIGFIGLVVPHLVRMITGAAHERVIPNAALMGAAVLSLSDLLARTIVAPAELPIGIVTALIGGPVFIYIILKEKKGASR